ncbi:MAG: hypothetical protein IT320_09255 [Anaerolineae bacterium]|nr:hypothetical protein [Anaerolineae bacterium]
MLIDLVGFGCRILPMRQFAIYSLFTPMIFLTINITLFKEMTSGNKLAFTFAYSGSLFLSKASFVFIKFIYHFYCEILERGECLLINTEKLAQSKEIMLNCFPEYLLSIASALQPRTMAIASV